MNPSPYRKFFSTLLVDMFEQPLAMAIEAITAPIGYYGPYGHYDKLYALKHGHDDCPKTWYNGAPYSPTK